MKAALLVLLAASPAFADDYGRAGVYELGASAGVNLDSVTLSPSLGWFVAENFEVSGVFEISRTDDSTMISSLVEPSYHVPFRPRLHGFLAMGIGYAYLEDRGGALAVAPRVGVNLRIGRSVITPSLSVVMTTHREMETARDASGPRLNLGYSTVF